MLVHSCMPEQSCRCFRCRLSATLPFLTHRPLPQFSFKLCYPSLTSVVLCYDSLFSTVLYFHHSLMFCPAIPPPALLSRPSLSSSPSFTTALSTTESFASLSFTSSPAFPLLPRLSLLRQRFVPELLSSLFVSALPDAFTRRLLLQVSAASSMAWCCCR